MLEIFNLVQEFGFYLLIAAGVIVASLCLIALAAAVYTAKTAFSPFLAIICWLFAYNFDRPNEIASQISLGARMLTWAAIVALLVWFLFR